MAMIDGERRSATGRASQDTLIAVLSRGRFETLIAERPGLGVRLLIRIARILSQRLRLASGQLVDHL
jgi:CRP-like cAMP-binding protein